MKSFDLSHYGSFLNVPLELLLHRIPIKADYVKIAFILMSLVAKSNTVFSGLVNKT